MTKKPLRLAPQPISFGTDGWRGILGVDFTLEKLLPVAIASSQELNYRKPSDLRSREIIIGYDRRFLADAMAEAVASAVRGCGLEPLLTDSPVTTPACSWAVKNHQALGALVITASHNPPEWLGLKIKSSLGGSVDSDFTKAVEQRLEAGGITIPVDGRTNRFECRKEHLNGLKSKFDIPEIIRGLKNVGLNVIIDPMYGSAAGCISELFCDAPSGLIREINSHCDPLFGGNPPEPLAKYISNLINIVKVSCDSGRPSLGLVFDGDGDRIAAVDENGNYCSTQYLMPLLIDHLIGIRNRPGSIVKTVSGCDQMRLVAENYRREIIELPVGFKYIAHEMITQEILIGGEESGGIGFGSHIPERDALYTSLVLLEAISQGKQLLFQRLDDLQLRFGKIFFDRIDLVFNTINEKDRLESFLSENIPDLVNGKRVKQIIKIDGIKFILDKNYWLMFRFSGTEPLLRVYSQAPSNEDLQSTLNWATKLVKSL
ncbi:phosphoglucomutase/phosphomannomutase family protein [Prochlorococcus sp. MIT 1223]|uniref:phosphoglucomutase/phosphomannomutase family protein n=1 Tax=Prochlorococcus sp. MIT 1223 TaxID=3096217 RepID=UPI002A7545AC|nr:phosphoglucomutase/phosphomannomutase family protein [Prochlorococcus sp. MIT 1223]